MALHLRCVYFVVCNLYTIFKNDAAWKRKKKKTNIKSIKHENEKG